MLDAKTLGEPTVTYFQKRILDDTGNGEYHRAPTIYRALFTAPLSSLRRTLRKFTSKYEKCREIDWSNVVFAYRGFRAASNASLSFSIIYRAIV